MQIENGVYAARPTAVSVTESKAGNLMTVIKFQIKEGPELTFYSVLAKTDGTINTRNVDDLKKWSGWDGCDPYWLMEADLTQTDVELVVENGPSLTDPSKTWPNIKWVNPPGQSGGAAMPKAADRGAVAAKWGAKFRALAGGAPAARRPAGPAPAAPAPAQPAPPPSRPAAKAPPAAPTRATQASAWAKLDAAAGNMPQAQKEELWFGFVDATGMDQADMTPAGWTQIEAAITAHFAQAEDPMPF